MIENIISTDSFISQAEFSTQGRFPMLTVTLCEIQMRMIITDQEHLLDSRSTWYCLTDLGEGVGSSNPKMLLPLLKRKELDSKTFTNDEIILGNFKGKESLPLANRGNTFVSLRGVLEILSKTELSSDIVDNFQDEVFGHLLPSLALTGRAELPTAIANPDSYMIEDKIERAKRWIEETEEWQKALSSEETAHAETKALLAEEKEHSDALEAQNKALTAERDEAIRTKAQIGDKKVATAMGTAGALSKKCDRLEKEVCELKEMNLQIYNACKAVRKEFEEAWITARDWCYNHKITVKINEPKWAVSAKLTEICEAHPDRGQWRRDARGTKLFPKWACDILDKVYEDDDTFLSEYRIV